MFFMKKFFVKQINFCRNKKKYTEGTYSICLQYVTTYAVCAISNYSCNSSDNIERFENL